MHLTPDTNFLQIIPISRSPLLHKRTHTLHLLEFSLFFHEMFHVLVPAETFTS